MTIRNLEAVLAPRAIVLIGASRRPGSVGEVLARNLLDGGFQGPIRFVNPNGGEIAGQPVHPSIASLPEPPDLAVIATPAGTVPGVIAELGARGGRAAVVISAGFEGAGRPAELRQAMLDAARPNLLRVIGPNCLGLISPALGINASFASAMPPAGRIALVAQSGAVAAAAMDSAGELGLGFSHVVTVGDCADVDVADLLEALALDRGTDAVLLYLEGISDARKFMTAARIAARLKPVAVLKAGRSAAGAKAALSHTGALAGAFAVYEAAFRRAGLLPVDDLGDLLQAGATFAAGLSVAGEGLAILTNGGGAGVLAADALDLLGERLAELTPETLAALNAVAPANWSRRNPVDILGDAPAAAYGAALEALLSAPEAGAVLVITCPTAVTASADVAAAVSRAVGASPAKPVLTVWMGGRSMDAARKIAAGARLPAYGAPEDAVRAYAHLSRARRNRDLLQHAPAASDPPPDPGAAAEIVSRAQAEGRSVLTDPETRAVLRAYGVPVVESREVATPDEAGAAAAAFAAPVALKILSHDISHKSDVGGVALGVDGAAATTDAARRMLAAVAAQRPDARIAGFVVEPMVRRDGAEEVLCGVVQDAAFGPVVLVGHGGVAAEVVADRAIGLPPLNEALAREMIGRTRLSRRLAGYRNHRPADLAALSRTLVALGQLACDLPAVAELDINPLLCDADGVLALDGRIAVAPAGAVASRPAILPYPAELAHRVLAGGESLLLRPIRPDDAERLGAMVAACSPQDIRLRFGAALRRLSPQAAAQLTQIDYDREMALVAVAVSGELLGVGRLCADPEGRSAEFALMVRTDRQGQGIGALLLQAVLDHARRRGLAQVWGETELDNGQMIELATALGFRSGASHEPGCVRLVLELPPP